MAFTPHALRIDLLSIYLFTLTLCLSVWPSYAEESASTPPVASLASNSALEPLAQRLQALTQQMNRPPGTITRDQVDQAQLDADSAVLQHQTARTDLSTTEKRIKELEQTVHTLETQEQVVRTTPLLDEVRHIQQLDLLRTDLAKRRDELDQEKKRLAYLQEQVKQTARYQTLTKEWQAQIEEQYRVQQEQQRRHVQAQRLMQLQQQMETYRAQAVQIRQQISDDNRQILSTARQQWLETQWHLLETRIRLLEEERRWVELDDTFARLAQAATQTHIDPRLLEQEWAQLTTLQGQLGTALTHLQSTQHLLTQQLAVIAGRQDFTGIDSRLSAQETQLITALLEELKPRQQRLDEWMNQLNHLQRLLTERYRERLPSYLLERTPLSLTGVALYRFGVDVISIGRVLLHQMQLSLQALQQAIQEATHWQWLWLAGSHLVLVGMLWGIRHLGHGVHRVVVVEAQPDSGAMIRVIAQWLWHHQWTFFIAAMLLISLFLLEVARPGRGILISVLLFALGLIAALHLTDYLLALGTSPATLPVRPTRRWKSYLSVIFWLSLSALLMAITLLVQLNLLEARLEMAFSHLSTLYCLLISLPVWRTRRFLLRLGHRRYSDRGWFRGLSLLSALLLVYLIVIAALGLAGYLHLTALIHWYGGWLFGMVGFALFLQGLLDDAADLMRQPLSRLPRYDPGWLQEWLWPAHRIATLLLIGLTGQVLLRVYSWQLPNPDHLLLTVLTVVISALILHELLYAIARFVARQQRSVLGRALVKFTHAPIQLILPLTALQWTLVYLPLSAKTAAFWSHTLLIGQIIAISWGLVSLVSVLNAVVVSRYRFDVKNNLAARRIHTQIQVLQQIVTLAVYIIAMAAILMTFPTARQLGAGLLASAGVAGLVIGMAARPLLANLIAGIQIGLTQPIRLDDIVIVEGEYGRIEEINSTHVVVCIWDLRRLVLPLNYFNEKPFQNWTRSSSDLVGTVFIHSDYSLPVDAVRAELQRLLDSTPLWDRQKWGLQVTQATEQTIELRATMSAVDAPTAWDLRCYIREQLIAFIQKQYPQCLPKRRALVEARNPSLSPDPPPASMVI